MVPLKTTQSEVYVATMTKILSDLYDALVDTHDNLKSLKPNSCPVNNVAGLCAVIMVDYESLKSDTNFNTEHLGYITRIFEDNFGSRLCL